MPRTVFRLSPYRLSIFRQCPRRYKYHYLDGLYRQYRKYWPFLTMGHNVHLALRRFFLTSNGDRTAANLENLLRTAWRDNRLGFSDKAEEKEYFGRALQQLRWFARTQDVAAQPFHSEAFYKVYLTPDFLVEGRIDRIDRQEDGSLHVVDYKTNKSARRADDLPLLIYALMLDRLRAKGGLVEPVGAASYLYLNGTGFDSVIPTAAALAETEAELLAARAEIMAEEAFSPRPSRLCAYCDFTELCEAADGHGPPEEDEPNDCET
ncbi:MAG: PD-(D/E)XK nuclease family protein [Dehalococcoidales bacterium]|nr:PD-(D/E)XK nuclease family protein [Dehalococcoidales bacterium]